MIPLLPPPPGSTTAASTPGPEVIDSWRLRAVLTLAVHAAGAAITVDQLVGQLRVAGFAVEGRPSKRVSDSLRSPVRRSWVVRVGRGSYAPGRLPKSTASRLRAIRAGGR